MLTAERNKREVAVDKMSTLFIFRIVKAHTALRSNQARQESAPISRKPVEMLRIIGERVRVTTNGA